MTDVFCTHISALGKVNYSNANLQYNFAEEEFAFIVNIPRSVRYYFIDMGFVGICLKILIVYCN